MPAPAPQFRVLRLGTRKSQLATRQSTLVATALVERGVAGAVELVKIVTQGDRESDRPIAEVWGTGVFTRELDEAVLDGRVDLAVHSMKDTPVERPAGIATAAVPRRADPRDALVSRDGRIFDDLPQQAVIATSSPRRRLQLLAARSDLGFRDIRGNVDTRIRAVTEERVDAVILAAAGLSRLGRAAAISQVFEAETCTPAPAQGALAVEASANRRDLVDAIAAALDDAATRAETIAERSFLAALGGGCRVPIGALARLENGELRLVGAIADPETGRVWRGERRGAAVDPVALGRALAGDVPAAQVPSPEIAERPHAGA